MVPLNGSGVTGLKYKTTHIQRLMTYIDRCIHYFLYIFIRPSTTDAAYRANHGPTDQVGSPTYRSEYYNKGYCRPDTIRSGTASGQRRNNPHPFKVRIQNILYHYQYCLDVLLLLIF